MKPIWIVDDDQSIRFVLEKALAREQFATRSFSNPRDVLAALASHSPESTYGLAKRLNLTRYTCRSALNRLANRPTPLVAVVRVQPSPNNSKPTYFYGLVS